MTLAGPANTVASDVEQITKLRGVIGLMLNTGKCELTAHQDRVVNDQMLQSFIRVDIEDALLLGVPLFAGTVLDNVW